MLSAAKIDSFKSLHLRSILSRDLHRPSRLWFQAPSFRSVSRFSTIRDLAEGDSVETTDGRHVTIQEKMPGGWWRCSFQENGIEKIVKIRSSGLKASKPDTPKRAQLFGAIETQTSQSRLDRLSSVMMDSSAQSTPIDIPCVVAPKRHASVDKWIVFSDIHVKSASIDTCERVLDAVHEEASKRNGGIIFLGDFWHVRGALSVDLLNRVMKIFRSWTRPVIMIPGNHDQVTLGGSVHAVEPLSYAFPPDLSLLLSDPAFCMGALWLPYRRDPSLMRNLLALPKISLMNTSCIFCHADVKGAFMNDNAKCNEGVEFTDFPPHIPVYSGHFHKPHTIRTDSLKLRYVGSPYQTSLSEAGQTKYLYCLQTFPFHDSDGKYRSEESQQFCRNLPTEFTEQLRHWHEAERWPIEIGRKYFKATSLNDSKLMKARSGDRVILPVTLGEDVIARRVAEGLKEKGIEVEMRFESLSSLKSKAFNGSVISPTSIEKNDTIGSSSSDDSAMNIDDLDPITVLNTFLSSPFYRDLSSTIDNSSTIMAQTTSKAAFLEETWNFGRELIRRIASEDNKGENYAKICDLRFDSVSLMNFGPYGGKKPIQYPLNQRGLVLIRGVSTDGTGADSNGSGKTTLAMSVLWALTGSMDTRLTLDGKANDVAFDSGSEQDRRTAEVQLRGTVNGKPFQINRRRGRKHELSFLCGEQDFTMQAVKDTQAKINEYLGVGDGKLQRCCFFGQHSHTMQSLLGLSDTKLKSELGLLVDTDIWIKASNQIRQIEKNAKTRQQELQVEKKVRTEERNKQELQCQYSNQGLATMLEENERLTTKYLQLLNSSTTANSNGFMKGNALALESEMDADEMRSWMFKSVDELQCEVDRIRQDMEMWMKDKIEPLSRNVSQSNNEKWQTLQDIESRIQQGREVIAKASSTMISLQNTTLSLQERLKVLGNQKSDCFRKIHPLWQFVFGFNESGRPADQEMYQPLNQSHYQSLFEKAMHEFKSLDIEKEKGKQAIQKIRELYDRNMVSSLQMNDRNRDNVNEKVGQDSKNLNTCPSCGHELSQAAMEDRLSNLERELLQLDEQWISCQQQYQHQKKILEAVQEISKHQALLQQYCIRLEECERDLQHQYSLTLEQNKKMNEGQLIVNRLTTLKNSTKEQFEKKEKDMEDLLKQWKATVEHQRMREKNLRLLLEKNQELEKNAAKEQNEYQQSLKVLEDRINTHRELLRERQDQLNTTLSLLNTLELEIENCTQSLMRADLLLNVFGPRGIQHFLYVDSLLQLQSIANDYLNTLAEGGIQITLQNSFQNASTSLEGSSSTSAGVLDDKIIKTVHIRGQDGNYRERGLSQLSGGQWRRVSLALDLAFTELMKRKGLLRSNLLVMDEVLTHLDASGREAVGSVLRSLVEGNGNSSIDKTMTTMNTTLTPNPISGVVIEEDVNDQDSGNENPLQSLLERRSMMEKVSLPYETIIVILQDLVATELEESFDHIDVVVKESDSSTVLID